jgi:crotonobetaine/carnitine-CoA ligase
MVAQTTVGGLLRERAAEHPDRLFLWCGDDRRSYGEVDAASDGIAGGLAELGIGSGDRIAVLSQNRVEFLELFFACAKLGAVIVPTNVFLKGDFLHYQLRDCEAETLVLDGPGAAAAAEVAPELPALKRVIALDDEAMSGFETIPYAQLSQVSAAPDAGVVAGSLLSIMYTSGTTGMPKGCMLAHGWYVNGARAGTDMMGYGADDVLYTALPLFHAWAQGMVMGALLHGLTAVVDPVFSASGVLQRLAETNATTFAGVGAMGMAMLATPESNDDRAHRLRAALMIPFPPEQQARLEQRFGARVLAQLYGQTECGAISYGRPGDPGDPASVGRPGINVEVRVVDDDDREILAGEVGEIVVRPKAPHALYLGYWRKPEATVEAWRNLWHHTGDYGRIGEAGSLFFVDRKKDALRRRGENVSSIEVEQAICAHPKIAEAAVHAVPSPMTEDDIKACLVLAPGEQVSPEELFAFFRDRLPYFAIPRYVEIVDELPRNATMRVMKHVLRDKGVTEGTWDLEALGLTLRSDERR